MQVYTVILIIVMLTEMGSLVQLVEHLARPGMSPAMLHTLGTGTTTVTAQYYQMIHRLLQSTRQHSEIQECLTSVPKTLLPRQRGLIREMAGTLRMEVETDMEMVGVRKEIVATWIDGMPLGRRLTMREFPYYLIPPGMKEIATLEPAPGGRPAHLYYNLIITNLDVVVGLAGVLAASLQL